MREQRAIIFDMDGVIINTEPVYWQIDLDLFRELDVPVTTEELARFVGTPDVVLWRHVKNRFPLRQSAEELAKEGDRRYLEHVRTSPAFSAMPGALELIGELHGRGVTLAIASSSSKAGIAAVISRLSLSSFFGVTVSGEDVSQGKPAPDIYALAARRLGLPPSECLAIEDSRNGVTSAKAAGMVAVGFLNPDAPAPQDLSQANLVVRDLRDLSAEQLLAL